MITNFIIIFLLASNLYLAKRVNKLDKILKKEKEDSFEADRYFDKKLKDIKDLLEITDARTYKLGLRIAHNEVDIENLKAHTNYKLIIPFENETAANKKKPSKSRSVNPKTRESKPTHRPKGRQTKSISKSTKASVSKKTTTTKGSKKVSVTKKK